MKVSTQKPFQIVYALFEHQFLGYLFESFVVQLDEQGKLTLQHQNISAVNAKEFAFGLDEKDYQLIELMDSIQQEVVIKKFYNKRVDPTEFFLSIYHKEKGNKALQEVIYQYVEERRAKILALLEGKELFEMANDGEPTHRRISVQPEKATVLFHFFRNEDNTHYFPTIKYKGEKLRFQFQNAIIVCDQPAWLMLDHHLYTFQKEVDGKKLRPFLKKKFIQVPKKIEESYYRKFIAPVIQSFDVHAKGFKIHTVRYTPTPLLSITEVANQKTLNIFEESEEKVEVLEDQKMILKLSFFYNEFKVKGEESVHASVTMEKKGEDYTFFKIMRDEYFEEEKKKQLKELGLPLENGKAVLNKLDAFSWLSTHNYTLIQAGFTIKQDANDEKQYFIGSSSINLEIRENNDWFDIYAIVKFGEYKMPFVDLRKLILADKREFTLPNGEIAVIPDVWFSKYAELFYFMEEANEGHQLKKYHYSLVKEMEEGNLAKVSMNRKLERLRDFTQIDNFPLPEGFKGELRPYQKAGFNWLNFLNEYNFGGCLADDMGLGKTVQTLTLLQKEKNVEQGHPSLLIMPTSLLYNWEMEAKKFTPKLKVFRFTGTNRTKDLKVFDYFDLIITSYGITRIDIELLEKYYFNYIILDESQAIKNPSSNIAKAVRRLKSRKRLILTGTPIENSTLDLWSQMNFVNPGLLGSQSFFKKEYLTPIEKKKDEDKSRRLHAKIKPFILRRHKSQVATELPGKIEKIQFCDMSEAQKTIYEETKSMYRNKILEHIEKKGVNKSQIVLLQGLTQLRQLANHPRMVDENYLEDSGKMQDVIYTLENAIGKEHKILIFSQFVKHLGLLKDHLLDSKIPFAYLDGSTKDRKSAVEKFQNNPKLPVFLISLKAGGLGLNLTAADYVFILDPWWNPAIEAQAIDRAHRIGQENKVFIYKFISKDTVEEKILSLQQSKLQLAQNLITTEDNFVKSLTKDDIEALLT